MDPTQGSRLALPTYFPTGQTPEIHLVGCTTVVAMAAMAEGTAEEEEETVEVEVVVDNDNSDGHYIHMFV